MAQDTADQPRPDSAALTAEVGALRREIERFNNHRFVQTQNSMTRMLMLQFLRGLALGLGTVIGASVLVSLVAYGLSKIDFLPIVGEWATEIATEIEAEISARREAPVGAEAPADAPAATDGE